MTDQKKKNKYAVPLTPYAPGGDLGVSMNESKQIKTFPDILNSKLSTGGLKANYLFGTLHFKEICESAEEYKNQFSSPQEVKIRYEGTDMLNLKEAFEAAREVRNQLWWDLKYPTFEDYINSKLNK